MRPGLTRIERQALRSSAGLIAAGALLSGPVAMLIVSRVAPQPRWVDAETFFVHYHPVQALPYLLGYILLAGFILFTASCHALAAPERRSGSAAALVCTGIYAALVFTNYTIQLGYIPRSMATRPAWVADLTMANPSSFAWYLEMFGYAAMGVATWLVAGGFGGSRRAGAIRLLLIGNGVVSIIGAACTALFDRWVFSTAGLVSFAGWNLVIVACYLLIAVSRDGGWAEASGGSR